MHTSWMNCYFNAYAVHYDEVDIIESAWRNQSSCNIFIFPVASIVKAHHPRHYNRRTDASYGVAKYITHTPRHTEKLISKKCSSCCFTELGHSRQENYYRTLSFECYLQPSSNKKDTEAKIFDENSPGCWVCFHYVSEKVTSHKAHNNH